MAIYQAIDNAINGDLKGQVGDFLGREAGSAIKAGGEFLKGKLGIEDNIYDAFLRNLLNSSNTLTLKPLWLCFLDSVPIGGSNKLDRNALGGPSEYTTYKTNTIDFKEGKAALLAQRCQFVGDSFNVTRPTNVEYNGFMPGGVSNTRAPYQTLKISYLETNRSFTDDVMRNWMIDSSYKSLKYAKRTNITVHKYTKRGFDESTYDKFTKQIIYHGCVPINIDTEELDYKGGDAIIVRQVEFFYDSYTIEFDGGEGYAGRGFLDRALEEFTGYKSIKSAIANIGSDAVNEVTSIAATGAQRLISNAPIFGRDGTTIGEAFGFGSGPETSKSSGRVNPAGNDAVISSPVQDDVRVANIDADTPNPTPEVDVGTRGRELNDVVNDQIKAANINDYIEVKPDSLDTPVVGLTYDYLQDDVIVDKNDTPVFGTPIQDDVRVNRDDTPRPEALNKIP